ncbi:DMT family transporter [Roseibium sp.]|uniref:DMT family transporter n=1 Tax=Roseibium sp. TaxID=1936156 RepID=UPI003A977912
MDLRDNGRAIAAMLTANACFMVNDVLVKFQAGHLQLGQIILLRGIFAVALLIVACQVTGVFRHWKRLLQPPVLLRALFETGAAALYLYALLNIPVANAAAILQILPLVVTAGAAVFLGAPVGWRRWLAIFIGLSGVLLIIRPGVEGFNAWSLVALASVFLMGARDLATRRVSVDVPTFGISLMSTIGVTLLGAVFIGLGEPQTIGGWAPLAALDFVVLGLTGMLLVGGYSFLIIAVRLGDISLVAPFRYSSVLWAMGLGFLVFGEVPDGLTLVGMVIIAATGIYTFLREHRLARRGALSQSAIAAVATVAAAGPVASSALDQEEPSEHATNQRPDVR